MLILRSKTVVIDNRPVKLFSLDGKLWFSKPHDFAEYKQRRAAVKTTVQHVFALRVLSEPRERRSELLGAVIIPCP